MPINRGLDKVHVVHIYKGILLSHKKERMPFAADLEIIILSEVSQKENDKQHMLSLEPGSPVSPALAGGFFTTRATWEVQEK